MTDLAALVGEMLARDVPAAVSEAAKILAAERGGIAVLFYGSVLRSGNLDDVLDFYVLTDASAGPRWRLWPDVSYHEIAFGERTLRAKVATMPLAAFAAAAAGRGLDTTIWTRFTQPAALAWANDGAVGSHVADAVADAAITAAGFAALHGPREGDPADYWEALFRATYATEWRVEAPGREKAIVAQHGVYFARLLPAAWQAGGIAFERRGDRVGARLTADQRRRLARQWRRARAAGKTLNIARLFKAAFTFQGASAYALYKVQRHTGVALPLTPWRERHPILAAPGVLWRVWRARPAS